MKAVRRVTIPTTPACGCGETSDRRFAPGHEFRAIQARIRDHFSGSPLALIQWIDNHPQPAS
jgi:hypothetical protein